MPIFQKTLSKITQELPALKLKAGTNFSWNGSHQTITYKVPKNPKQDLVYTNKLLHELAHAKLNHSEYQSDIELIKMESAAWQLTEQLCKKYEVKFSKQEQKSALQSYINWASSRSSCPNCTKNGLQISKLEFSCPNCFHNWKVGTSRFKRTYRQTP